MAPNKKIAKQLKRPDQFVDFWTRASNNVGVFLEKRRKPALAVAVALAVAIGGNAIAEWREGKKRTEASEVLARIERVALADLLPAAGASSTGDSLGADAQAADADVPRFKTAPERRDAVLRELDAFLGKYENTDLADEALLMKGSQLLAAGRHDDAIKAYRAALDEKLSPGVRYLAEEGIAYAYEGKGDLAKALETFGRLGGEGQGAGRFYRDRALYHQARLTERKGDSAAAVKLYREVLDKSPDTSLRDQITDRLALIEAK